MKIFLATKNKGKIEDFKKLTENMDIEVVTILDNIDIPDVVEDGDTFEENSAKKALEIAKYTGIVTVSDDSGLCVDYLNGAPGVYSARYSGENATDESNMDKLLEDLKDVNFGENEEYIDYGAIYNQKYPLLRKAYENFKANGNKELKEKFGIFKIIETEIPMDKRHNSKTDYKRLEEIVEKL